MMLSLYEKWDRIDPIDKIDKRWFSSDKGYDYIKSILAEKGKLLLIAKEEENITGYILAEIAKRKPFLEETGYIAEAYTKAGSRGKGIGSALLKKAISWFSGKKIRWITVGTHSLDDESISFWKRKGFIEFNKMFKLSNKTIK